MIRIEPWKERIEELTRQIDHYKKGNDRDKAAKDARIRKKNRLIEELKYWKGKYDRFTMTEVSEGFALRQGAGIGLISKYAALYLKSYFHDTLHPERRQVYSIKGTVTSVFRKMWGIQEEYEKKSRDNHTHHCIDAIVIACIGKNEFNRMGEYYHVKEKYERGEGQRPEFEKPWPTFTQDLKQITEELLVVHDTPDNMPKKASRMIDTKHGKKIATGDCARGSLHQDTYYGAIKPHGEDNVRYVVRRSLDSLKESDIANIVDDAVREKVREAVCRLGFKEAMAGPIYMNEEKGILIKKVRCFAPTVTSPLPIREKKQRDISRKEYKRPFYVVNDENYMMAIYEGGKMQMITALDAAKFYNKHDCPTIAQEEYKGKKLKYLVRKGTQIIMLEKDEESISTSIPKELFKRLYTITKLEKDGRLTLRHNAEARPATDINKFLNAEPFILNADFRPLIRVSLSKFNFLVEGFDFIITPLGEIKLIH